MLSGVVKVVFLFSKTTGTTKTTFFGGCIAMLSKVVMVVFLFQKTTRTQYKPMSLYALRKQ